MFYYYIKLIYPVIMHVINIDLTYCLSRNYQNLLLKQKWLMKTINLNQNHVNF